MLTLKTIIKELIFGTDKVSHSKTNWSFQAPIWGHIRIIRKQLRTLPELNSKLCKISLFQCKYDILKGTGIPEIEQARTSIASELFK